MTVLTDEKMEKPLISTQYLYFLAVWTKFDKFYFTLLKNEEINGSEENFISIIITKNNMYVNDHERRKYHCTLTENLEQQQLYCCFFFIFLYCTDLECYNINNTVHKNNNF